MSLSSSSDLLPIRITPCPILDAFAEVRCQPSVSSAILPGLVFAAVRDLFPAQSTLPDGPLPDPVRIQTPLLRYRPTMVLRGEVFDLHVGPQVFFIGCKKKQYPGWP